VARDVGPLVKPLLLQEVEKAGVEIYVNSEVTDVGPDWVEFGYNGRLHQIAVDTIVLAVGYQPRNLDIKTDGRFVAIGDAKEARNALHAIHEGFLAGAAV